MNKNIYISSCEEDGGIYRYVLNNDGSLTFADVTPMDRPMYTVIYDNKLYVLLRAPYSDNPFSGLVCCNINEDGSLSAPDKPISTKGECACHLYVDGDGVFCVNYISGSIIKMPDKTVTHKGSGVHPTRQSSPHTHFVSVMPDGEHICVTDLGLDTIFVYTKNLDLVSTAKVPEGHGVRHLAFSDDGKYCFAANELESTLSVFEVSGTNLEYKYSKSCLPDGFNEKSTIAAVRYSDGRVYVSNRGHDSIAVFDFADGKLNLAGIYNCGGCEPRDFNIYGDYIVCSNQNSHNLTVIDKNTMQIIYEVNDIKSPLCVN